MRERTDRQEADGVRPSTPDRLRALLDLAVRASGAQGGALVLATRDRIETGQLSAEKTTVELSGAGRIELYGAHDCSGIAAMIAPLVDGPRAREHAANIRVEALERELHHRTGNLLQTISSFLSMQAQEFSAGDEAPGAALALIDEARTRVAMIGAVQASIDAALEDGAPGDGVATARQLPALCEHLSDLLPQRVAFSSHLVDLDLNRLEATALGIVVAEFALAATRDAFPQPSSHAVHVKTRAHEERGRHHITLELHHGSPGYDMTAWTHGAPTLSARIVEAAAMQMDGLVVMDRSTDGDEAGSGPGLRLRLVFDGAASGVTAHETGGEGVPFLDSVRSFDTRLGVVTGTATLRKS